MYSYKIEFKSILTAVEILKRVKPILVFPSAVQGCTTYKQPCRLIGTQRLNIEVICRPITSAVSDSFLCAPQGSVCPKKNQGEIEVFQEPNSIVLIGNV